MVQESLHKKGMLRADAIHHHDVKGERWDRIQQMVFDTPKPTPERPELLPDIRARVLSFGSKFAQAVHMLAKVQELNIRADVVHKERLDSQGELGAKHAQITQLEIKVEQVQAAIQRGEKAAKDLCERAENVSPGVGEEFKDSIKLALRNKGSVPEGARPEEKPEEDHRTVFGAGSFDG